MSKRILVVAGEVSGDMHAARLLDAARERGAELELFGIGGDELEERGMEVLFHVRDMAVMGFWEVFKRYGFFKKVFQQVIREMETRKPDALLLVDYPGFNLRLAGEAKKRGIKVIYYICPQVWAWKKNRIPKMAEVVDRLMVIFPFEVDVFKGTGLQTDFVGHPLVDEAAAHLAQPEQGLPWKGTKKVALLPGSRKQEIERIFPALWEAALALEKKEPQVSFIVAAPSSRIARMIEACRRGVGVGPASFEVVVGKTREVLRQADAAWVASGTATIETALMNCPMLVVYKTAWLTYEFGRRVVQIDHIGMVNVISGRTVCPEFIQHDAEPEKLAEAIRPLLSDTPERKKMLEDLAQVREKLGEGGAADRAAEVFLEALGDG